MTRASTRVSVALLAVLALSGCLRGDPEPPPSKRPAGDTVEALSDGPLIVSRVADGDTITVRTAVGRKVKIRLLGIDAPEVQHGGQAGTCGGDAARDHIRGLVAGRRVDVTLDRRSDHVDRYDRVLGYVDVDGVDVAESMARAGYADAWYPRSEPRPDRYRLYRDLADTARDGKVGAWATCPELGRTN